MSRTPTPWLVRLYGWALQLYPPRFRARFGDDMLQLFRDRYRDEARRGWDCIALVRHPDERRLPAPPSENDEAAASQWNAAASRTYCEPIRPGRVP